MALRWIALMLLAASPGAWAQSRGSVTIRGHVSEMASLRFFSHQPVGEAVSGNNAEGQGGLLQYTLDLGDVGVVPGRDNSVRGGEVTLILRSNTAYVLTASVSGSGFKPGAGEIQLSDIGFGIPSSRVVPSGDRARSEATQVVNPAKFDNDPIRAPVSRGAPAYAATLADLEGGEVPILRGDRISYGGSLNSSNNGLLVSTRYAVHPQYFRENARFEATVTYTISTP